MCLAVPAKLVRIDGYDAVADLHGNQVRVSTRLVPDVHLGDWVLVHAGFAIQKLDEDEAAETFSILRDVEAAAAQEAAEEAAAASAESASQGASTASGIDMNAASARRERT